MVSTWVLYFNHHTTSSAKKLVWRLLCSKQFISLFIIQSNLELLDPVYRLDDSFTFTCMSIIVTSNILVILHDIIYPLQIVWLLHDFAVTFVHIVNVEHWLIPDCVLTTPVKILLLHLEYYETDMETVLEDTCNFILPSICHHMNAVTDIISFQIWGWSIHHSGSTEISWW